MHIAFFNRSFYPDTTATGQLLTDLCEDLVRDHGCRVSVVAGVPLLPTQRVDVRGIVGRERYRGVEIHRARGTRFSKDRFIGRATNYLTYFLSATYAGLRLDRPDVVVALTDPPIVGLAAWLAGKRHGAPLVMAFKDLFPEVAALLKDFHSDTVNGLLQRVNQFLVRRAARNVALGEMMRARLIENKGAPPDTTVIIADWADTSAITPGPKRNAFSEAHGLADKFVVMHSGNIGLSQNLETVIDAAALLRDVLNLQIVFVGEGVKKPDLQARSAALGLANVTFLPFTPRERLGESFAALTTRNECGLIAEPGNARDLADRILDFHRDRDLAARCGANARRAGLTFDRRGQVAKYMQLFQDVARPAAAGAAATVAERKA